MIDSEAQNSTRRRILIVEDEGIIARDLAAMLEQLGYQVVGQASTHDEAIELATTLPIDLVLMDIKIRGSKDGVETAEDIRRELGLPIVFVTAHADSDTLRRANISQPFGYVVKPFNEAVLRVAIEVALTRHQLQATSDRAHTWHRRTLEGINEAIIATDAEGRIAVMNAGAQELTGCTAAEAIGQPLGDILYLLDGGAEINLIESLKQSPGNELLVLPNALIRSRSDKYSAVTCSFARLQRSAGQTGPGYVALIRSNSVPSQIDRLTSSNKQLQDLSYALSNDLREPVRNISCFANLLARNETAKLDKSSLEYLDFIVEGSKRIESQMSALRTFHLAGSVNAISGVFADATEICTEVVAHLAEKIGQAKAVIQLGPLPSLEIDPAALRAIVLNLITNALQFRADRPLRLEINARRTGALWELCFSDNGLGFHSSQSERIFGIFAKAHASPPSGNGIGLATCRRAVEAVGGRIWAESREGKGTDFFLTLPPVKSKLVEAA